MMELPMYISIEDLYFSKDSTHTDIVQSISHDYPQYVILGPMKCQSIKGGKLVSCLLKFNQILSFQEDYSL